MATVTKGKIFRSDLDNYDGTLATSRTNSSGGTENGLKVGNGVDVLQVFGSGDTSNQTLSTVSLATSTLGTQNIALIFAPGTWTIDDDITIASNFTVVFPAGCVFNVSAGKTVTVAGIFFRQHDTYSSGSGTFTISGTDILAPTLGTLQQLSSVAGTNTITASAATTLGSYTANDIFIFTPANDNTGAVTLNIDSVGAGAIQLNGAALVGGELQASVPVIIQTTNATPTFEIIGNGAFQINTQGADIASAGALAVNVPGTFHDVTGTTTITSLAAVQVGTLKILQFDGILTLTHNATDLILFGGVNKTTYAGYIAGFYEYASGDWRQIFDNESGGILGTEQASTSGTSIDFTSIPSWVKKIDVNFVGVSTSGTDALLIQIGDSGGVETSGYLGASGSANYTAGYGVSGTAAANVIHGTITLSLEDAANFTWVASGVVGLSNAATLISTGASKSLSATLDRVRITTTGGTDTFDAGAINIHYY